MGNLILYKFGVIGILVVVALWSFHVLPDGTDNTKAVLSEEFFNEPVASSSATPSLAPTFSPANTPVLVLTPTPTLTQTPVIMVTPTPVLTKTPLPTKLISTPIFTPIPSTTPLPIFTPPITPTPFYVPKPFVSPEPVTEAGTPTTTPTQTPAPTPTPVSGHIFYLSTYSTAKYYYCDTDNGWKSLSEKYLKSYLSEEELLADYPTRIFHEPCE